MKNFAGFIIMILALSLLPSCEQKSPVTSDASETLSESSSYPGSRSDDSDSGTSTESSISGTIDTASSSGGVSSSSVSIGPTAIPTAVPAVTSEKAVLFNDAVLEKILRLQAKKSSGNVYPSDFSPWFNENVLYCYQYWDDSTVNFNEKDDATYSTKGRITNFDALSTIPFKKLVISYGVSPDAPDTAYTLDMDSLTQSGVLEYFRAVGNCGGDSDDRHIQPLIITNFSGLSRCSNLTSLRFDNCRGVDMGMSVTWSKLQYVSLVNCSIGSIAALRNSPNLTYLSIDYNPITDLSPIAGNAGLQKVLLHDLTAVDVPTLLTLPNLKEVRIDSCAKITRSDFDQFRAKDVTVIINGSTNTFPPPGY